MCPCKLGIGSFSNALSRSRERFCACLIEGNALDKEADPACFDAVLKLNSKESNRNSNSGLVSEKKVCICMDKFCKRSSCILSVKALTSLDLENLSLFIINCLYFSTFSSSERLHL